MSGDRASLVLVTLAEAQAELALWQAALEAILGGAQSYTIAGRSLTRANLADVRSGLAAARARVDGLTAGRGTGARVMRVMPRDF